MEKKIYFFPFPYAYKGNKIDGTVLAWPSRCQKCVQNSCLKSNTAGLSTCSYGFNFEKIDSDVVFGGFVIRNIPIISPAHKKTLKEYSKYSITKEQYEFATQSIKKYEIDFEDQIAKEKKKIIDDYVKNEQFKPEFLVPLRQEIVKGQSFVHDYKQINTQIAQNINVIIETNRKGDNFEQKLEAASDAEKAIYVASKLLEEKLNVAKLLVNPYLINNESDFAKFRFHGIVIKYRRIYTPQIEKKRIDLRLTGHSELEIIAHPMAISVIPHTLLDNAIKYSPKENGVIEINVQDDTDKINFSVSSYGPRILPEEEGKIFEPFFRGQAAIKQEEEGAGYGLYVAQLVAKQHLGTSIIVKQEPAQRPHYGHWTTFKITIPLKAVPIQ